MAKVKTADALERAIEVALHYDDKVLVEEAIEPLLEITLPIMGNDDIKTAHCERPLNKTEFFDFQDKYLAGGKGGKSGGVNNAYSEVPADIGVFMTAEIKDIGVRVYRALDCAGIARVDFLVNADTRQVYVNEVNTLPGNCTTTTGKRPEFQTWISLKASSVLPKNATRLNQKRRTHSHPTSSKRSEGPKMQNP